MFNHRRVVKNDSGQATVELVLVLPVVVLLALSWTSMGLVVRSAILVEHAAREGARAAAVGDSSRKIENAVIGSTGFSPAAVRVQRNFRGDRVTVEVFYTDPTDVPMIGNLFPDIVVSGSATMRRET